MELNAEFKAQQRKTNAARHAQRKMACSMMHMVFDSLNSVKSVKKPTQPMKQEERHPCLLGRKPNNGMISGRSGVRKTCRVQEGSLVPKKATITVQEARHGTFKGEVLQKNVVREIGMAEQKGRRAA